MIKVKSEIFGDCTVEITGKTPYAVSEMCMAICTFAMDICNKTNIKKDPKELIKIMCNTCIDTIDDMKLEETNKNEHR